MNLELAAKKFGEARDLQDLISATVSTIENLEAQINANAQEIEKRKNLEAQNEQLTKECNGKIKELDGLSAKLKSIKEELEGAGYSMPKEQVQHKGFVSL